ncbi:MAG: M55 family metallopeptidase [Anaerovoracaceae bacterium]
MQKKTYFISADIEGITDVTDWCETVPGGDGYEAACEQMTREVAAACEAILEAGHDVVVRDGHDNARNINHRMLPRGVKLMRGWACHPGSMMAGLDEKYAGVIYIGYHAPAGSNASPLAHTVEYDLIKWLKINGKLASEFTLNTLYAAQQGVAPIFISGDAEICRMAKEEVPQITTVAVKDCRGNSTFNVHPDDACQMIKEGVARALQTEVPVPQLPEEFVMDVCLCRHQQVRSAQVHPNVEKLDEFTVRYVAKTPTELNVMREFIMG